MVGKWGRGPSVEVTGQDSLVFLSLGSQVAIINFADPDNPQVLSEPQAMGLVTQAAVRDSFLYIGARTGQAGIEVWNIADPRNPVLRSRTPTLLSDFCIRDTFLYLTQSLSGPNDTFKIYSIANPENVYLLGSCRDSGDAVTVTSNAAFLADRWGLYALDVSDPANPRRVGSYPGVPISVEARGNILCVSFMDPNQPDWLRFEILDVSSPAAPRRLGHLDDAGGYDIFLAETLAFLSGYYTGGHTFRIVDITDSTRPRIISSTPTPGEGCGAWVNLLTERAYVADRFAGLTVLDISNLNMPAVDTSLLRAGFAEEVCVAGSRAYIGATSFGMAILDVSTPASPRQLGSVDSTRRVSTKAVAVADSIAYIGFTPSWASLRAVDVTDPTRPVTIGGINAFNPPEAVVVRDNFVYVAETNRFEVVSVARPREPVLVGSCQTQDGTAFGLAVQNSFAYLMSRRLQIVSIADPTAPHIVGSVERWSAGIAVRDTFAYFSGDTLFVYSVANPAQPRMLSATPTGIWPLDVALNENSLFVGGTHGVEVYDVSDPAHPRRTGGASTPYGVRRLHYSDGLLYAAMWDAGVAIFETTAVGITEPRTRAEPSQSALRVRPNPVTRWCFLDIGQTDIREVSVRDIAGRRVALPQVPVAQMMKLDFGELSPGLYFVEATSSGQREFVKIIRR
ncbi:MAG: T9SS type A sorting domain-containing protein [bacterium]